MMETVETDIEIKSNPDKLYAILSNQNHVIPTAASNHIHHVSVHEGDWETSGSVRLWKYTVDGIVETFKDRVEVDEAKKWVSLTALEGSHVLEQYKSYKTILQVIPKGEGEGGVVKAAIEYERIKENNPPPHKYLGFVVNVIQDIDAHLLKE